jgi:hypothetical protein
MQVIIFVQIMIDYDFGWQCKEISHLVLAITGDTYVNGILMAQPPICILPIFPNI